MGIPSYFAHIIKNHIHILKKFECQHFDNLFMDCNSIIYDCVRQLENSNDSQQILLKPLVLYKQLCINICNKIQYYINILRPSNTVYIAFDGVAPLAKMDQQKSRRVRNAYLESVGISGGQKEQRSLAAASFDTSQITPGTEFMKYLANHINKHYFDGPQLVIVSASDEPGEGEHKIFQYIRDNPLSQESTAIYGLDADLLMLSLFHTKYTQLFVVRESPEFAKSLNADLEPNLLYVLDIAQFAQTICTQESMPVNDYVFLCFLLGNDFLPHFPAVNIRTHGIQHLLDAYRETGSPKIIGPTGINWGNFKRILKWLAKYEEAWIQHEYLQRNEYFIRHDDTSKDSVNKEKMFNNVPMIYRATEHYINPLLPHWRKRYYKSLFKEIATLRVLQSNGVTLMHFATQNAGKPFLQKTQETTDFNVKPICQNYYEGLEWVYKYYTNQCFDWRWKYNYNYPPLLVDLAIYNPKSVYFSVPVNNSYSAKEQLAYVMPPANPENAKFEWAWCKYFWESHLV